MAELSHGKLESDGRTSFCLGLIWWNMFDFGAAHRTEDDRPGVNDKGLATRDRKIRKDAFYL